MKTDDGESGVPPARSRRRKGARAGELRAAALALFVEKGFEATRADEIAARAGISKGTMYLYYPSKEDLLRAAVASPALDAVARHRPATVREGHGADNLRRVAREAWSLLRDEAVGSVLKLAVAEARRFPEIPQLWLGAVVRPLRSSIAEAVAAGMDRGQFRRVDPQGVAHSLLLPMFMSRLQPQVIDHDAAAHGRAEDGFIAQHIELVIQGLVPVREEG
jgi:AcrR family transcriptional regulator